MNCQRKCALFACLGWLAACSAQGEEPSPIDSANPRVDEALAKPTSERLAPGLSLDLPTRPIVAVRPERRRVPTHHADVTTLSASTPKTPLDSDTQEGSISLSASK